MAYVPVLRLSAPEAALAFLRRYAHTIAECTGVYQSVPECTGVY